ncbi:hypothetical protein HY442_00165, partial [Candidatus Parcubacteria bacterium]|nr:hypothetical protein [Candidatus Parcubacteria bacterium]
EGGGETDDQAVAEVMGLFNRAYNPRGEQPKGVDPGVGGGGDEPDDGDEPKHPAIRLGCRQEFEVGEQIEIRAHLRDDLATYLGHGELEWFTERSRGRKACKTGKGMTLEAVELGDASVRAALPGTPYSALATYRVVAKRVFTLSATHASIHTGLDMLLTAVNLDKLKGEVVWSLSGVGRLTVEGGRVFYHATTPGSAEVVACDSQNPRTLAACQIQVSARPGRLLCIRGEFFRVDDTSYESERIARSAAPPVRIIQGDPVHTLIFDRGAPGYRLALAQGTAPVFIALAVAQAYARFCWLRQQGLNPGEFNFRDLPVVLEEVETAGYGIFEEALKERRSSS